MSRTEPADADASTDATPDEPIHVDGGAHFEDLVETYDVVLTDFYADWCGPCKMIEPIVADIAESLDVAVAKVDVDAHNALAAEYGVQGVPTLLVFADGETEERVVGARNRAALVDLVERYVEN